MKKRTMTKLAALAGAFAMTMMSTCAVFAESDISLYKDVQNGIIGPANPYMEYDASRNEFIDHTPDDQYKIEMDDTVTNPNAKTIKNIDWNVMPSYIKCTSGFRASSGGSIVVTALMTPSTSYIYYGIIEPNAVKRCVYGKYSIAHSFALDQTGRYNVYVRNENNHYVQVDGSYRY